MKQYSRQVVLEYALLFFAFTVLVLAFAFAGCISPAAPTVAPPQGGVYRLSDYYRYPGEANTILELHFNADSITGAETTYFDDYHTQSAQYGIRSGAFIYGHADTIARVSITHGTLYAVGSFDTLRSLYPIQVSPSSPTQWLPVFFIKQ